MPIVYEDPMFNIHVGNRLRLARKYSKQTLKEVSSFLGISYQAMQKIEYGRCNISVARLKVLADYLNVSISWFFVGYVTVSDEVRPMTR